jgi:FkbM family methyltransferase
LLAASKGYETHAVEPSHKNYKALTRSQAHNSFGTKITLHHVALSSEVGGSLCMKGIHGPHGNIGNVALTAHNYHSERDLQVQCPEEDRIHISPLDAVVPINANWGFAMVGCDGCEARAILGGRSIWDGPYPPCVLSIDWNHANTVNIEGEHLNSVLEEAGEVLQKAGYLFHHPRFHSALSNATKVEILEADTSKGASFWHHHFQLLAVHPSERCFPPDSAKWKALKERLLTGHAEV